MSDPFDRGYRKVALLDELPAGQPRLFRTGGAIILVLKTANGSIAAADATDCVDSSLERTQRERLAEIASCLGGSELLPADWEALLSEKSLPTETRNSEVWVCVDLCQK